MKFINELAEGEKVEAVFAVTDKQARVTRAGRAFICMRLSDRTGSIEALVWDNTEELSKRFNKGDFIGVRAEVGSYNGTSQLNVQNLKKVDKTPEYLARILPNTEKDVGRMADEIKEIISTVGNTGIRTLLEGIFGEEGFMEAFSVSPAAKGMHHVFLGGLLQHTLKVARLSILIYDEYKSGDPMVASMIDRDLLVAGALLHDIGKVQELSKEPGFDYTFKGRLLGHVSLGLMVLKERLDKTEG
ncbi:MAG: OB-fold nucleic acid binding domain-containing protein, partial [Nitrospirota bacterium]